MLDSKIASCSLGVIASSSWAVQTLWFMDRGYSSCVAGTGPKKPSRYDCERRVVVGGNGLAPSTVRRTRGVLRRAPHQGLRWGWLGVSPANVSPPRVVE